LDTQIDVAMGFDRNYAPHAAVVIASIVRHATDAALRFIIVHDGVERALQERVESVAPRAKFVWIQIGDDDVPEYETRGHLNRSVLFRLSLEKLAPADCTRVIYIDADTVVLRDIRELWRSDITGYSIGAVVDCYLAAEKFAERWGLPMDAPKYFNAGVLLVDLARVRAEKSFSAALDFVATHNQKLLLGDQDALNVVFWGRWKSVGADWNVQRVRTQAEFEAELSPDRRLSPSGPALVHYITDDKPWKADVWHHWAWLYWDNLKRTPFFDDVVRTYEVSLYRRLRMLVKWLRSRPRIRAAAPI